MNRIAELAKECNALNNKFAEVRYILSKNLVFTETGGLYVIDKHCIEAYNEAKEALETKIEEWKVEIEKADKEHEKE